MTENLIFFLLGFIIGWSAYGLILQLAYKLNILEYKGVKKNSTTNLL